MVFPTKQLIVVYSRIFGSFEVLKHESCRESWANAMVCTTFSFRAHAVQRLPILWLKIADCCLGNSRVWLCVFLMSCDSWWWVFEFWAPELKSWTPEKKPVTKMLTGVFSGVFSGVGIDIFRRDVRWTLVGHTFQPITNFSTPENHSRFSTPE